MTKRSKTSIATILSCTVLLTAGGSITPLQKQSSSPEPLKYLTTDGLYFGGGYSYLSMNRTGTLGKVNGSGIGLLAGYNFNEYVAVEGRFYQTLGNLNVELGKDRGDLSNIALYLKPQYLVSNIFRLYGLLGYGQFTLDDSISDLSETALQYGGGISVMATESVGLYVDYTRLYEDDTFDILTKKDIGIDSVNIGVYYNF